MKALRNPATIAALLALQACSTTSTQVGEPMTKASLDQPDTIVPQTFILRGQAVIGSEARTLTPCGSNQQYWLELSPEQLKQAKALSHSPYQPLYAEVVGQLRLPTRTGPDADFTARFQVDHLNLVSAENPQRCDQSPRPTRAFGTEPFWSASFEGQQLVVRTPGGADQPVAIESRRIESDTRQYRLQGGELTLERAACSDGMSDSVYAWRSTLELNDKTYQGCATLANADGSQHWIGQYQAQSTQTSNFSITLELNTDHSATTRYDYHNGDPSIVETGYWQPLNPEQVQVMMTRHQRQYLLSERIFTRTGDTLSANKEKVGTLVYPIANGGLQLYRAGSQAGTDPKSIPSSNTFDPQVDQAVRQYLKQTNNPAAGTHYRWLTYDLNGDGQPELLTQLDWCGSGGCTLLIFEKRAQQWHINSRVTLVRTPLTLGTQQHQGWQDLILNVGGGGAQAADHVLRYNGKRYPLNPSTAPQADAANISETTLFSDGLSPALHGLAL